MIGNYLDNVIGEFFPTWAHKRMLSRRLMDTVRKYDSAGKGPRTAGWLSSLFGGGVDANSENQESIILTRERTRDLYRNNAWVRRGVDVLVNNVIGTGIRPSIEEDGTNALFREWASDPRVSTTGDMNLYGIQGLCARSLYTDGEVLIRRRIRKNSGLAIPLQLQVLEADFIDTSVNEIQRRSDDGRPFSRTVQGVKFDSTGRKIGYWLFPTHPGSNDTTATSPIFVRAEEIIHLKDSRRPGEVRAVSRLAPIVQKAKNIDIYDDAELEKQKISSLFAAFYKDVDCDDENFNTKKTHDVPSHMTPGTIEFLPPGMDVEFSNPPSKEGYSEFMRYQLLPLSAAIGITYEALTNDLRQTSFSSGRIGQHEMTRGITYDQDHIFVNNMLWRVGNWWSELGNLTQTSVPAENTIKWRRPSRFIVDIKAETEAAKEQVRSGFKTLPSAISDMSGEDPEDVINEIEKWNKIVDAKGIILDTDPRNTTAQGQAQLVAEENPESDDRARSIDAAILGMVDSIADRNNSGEKKLAGKLYKDDNGVLMKADEQGILHELRPDT